MEECIFCKIQSGKTKTSLLYEDENIVAFEDLYPKAPHHVLLVPRKHISTMNDLTEEDTKLIGTMMIVAAKIAKQLKIDQDGYRVLMNCNRGGGQEIYHIHLHLLGGRKMQWPPG